jgi:hypothetical protein
MLTSIFIMVLVSELWCYMHEAQHLMPYFIGAAIVTSAIDFLTRRSYVKVKSS